MTTTSQQRKNKSQAGGAGAPKGRTSSQRRADAYVRMVMRMAAAAGGERGKGAEGQRGGEGRGSGGKKSKKSGASAALVAAARRASCPSAPLPLCPSLSGGAGGLGRQNSRVFLTCCHDEPGCPGSACVATRDLSDRAHCVFDQTMFLVPARALKGAGLEAGPTGGPIGVSVARRYPRSSMTSRGVAFDSAYDEMYARQCLLRGVEGVGYSAVTLASVRDEAVAKVGGEVARAVVNANHRAFGVGSVASVAMRAFKRGEITRAECERLCLESQRQGFTTETQRAQRKAGIV